MWDFIQTDTLGETPGLFPWQPKAMIATQHKIAQGYSA